MSLPTRPRVVLAMRPGLRDRLLDDDSLQRLRRVADLGDIDGHEAVLHEFDSPVARQLIGSADVLVTGWGCPPITADVLAAMPRLRAVVHAAGSVKHHVTEAVWERGVVVSSAAGANAIPVAEYTIAAILWADKGVLAAAQRYRHERRALDVLAEFPAAGNHGKRVGVVGASRIGRRVIDLLQPYDLEVCVADPLLSADDAVALGVHRLDLDELVSSSDVVTLHAPDVPETRHLIDARRLALMKDGATLVNTARGALVDTAALTAAVVAGRVNAVLDVTDPEVLPADSPLYDHPNVVLTPHIAGSLGTELTRLGASAVDEVVRLARGEPLAHEVRAADLARGA